MRSWLEIHTKEQKAQHHSFNRFSNPALQNILFPDEEEEDYDDTTENDYTDPYESQPVPTSYADARQWGSNLSPEMKAQLAK